MNVLQAMMMLSQINQIKNNPMELLSKKYNIPNDVNLSDPSAILNHLVNSGQVSQNAIDQIKSQMGMK